MIDEHSGKLLSILRNLISKSDSISKITNLPEILIKFINSYEHYSQFVSSSIANCYQGKNPLKPTNLAFSFIISTKQSFNDILCAIDIIYAKGLNLLIETLEKSFIDIISKLNQYAHLSSSHFHEDLIKTGVYMLKDQLKQQKLQIDILITRLKNGKKCDFDQILENLKHLQIQTNAYLEHNFPINKFTATQRSTLRANIVKYFCILIDAVFLMNNFPHFLEELELEIKEFTMAFNITNAKLEIPIKIGDDFDNDADQSSDNCVMSDITIFETEIKSSDNNK